MGRAGGPMTSPFGEDWSLECTMEPDERTVKPANNAFAIALQVRLRHKERGRANGDEH